MKKLHKYLFRIVIVFLILFSSILFPQRSSDVNVFDNGNTTDGYCYTSSKYIVDYHTIAECWLKMNGYTQDSDFDEDFGINPSATANVSCDDPSGSQNWYLLSYHYYGDEEVDKYNDSDSGFW